MNFGDDGSKSMFLFSTSGTSGENLAKNSNNEI